MNLSRFNARDHPLKKKRNQIWLLDSAFFIGLLSRNLEYFPLSVSSSKRAHIKLLTQFARSGEAMITVVTASFVPTGRMITVTRRFSMEPRAMAPSTPPMVRLSTCAS